MGGKKILLVLAGLALLIIGLIMLRSKPDEPNAPTATSDPDTSRGFAFEVHVDKPRLHRPLGGILPMKLEEKVFGVAELRFDQTSPGAVAVTVEPKRVELRATGWVVLVESDGEGKIHPGTRLMFPIELANRQRTLRCRPADPANGHFSSTVGTVSGKIDGQFVIEFATCENAETGNKLDWPSAPLTVRGNFAGLPATRR